MIAAKDPSLVLRIQRVFVLKVEFEKMRAVIREQYPAQGKDHDDHAGKEADRG